MSLDFGKLNHRIGHGSAYDLDMDLIESFVKITKNPNDKALSLELNQYYLSRATHYFNVLKTYLYDPEILKSEGISFNEESWVYNILYERNRRRTHLYHVYPPFSVNIYESESENKMGESLSMEDYLETLYPIGDYVTPTELKLGKKLSKKELRYYTAYYPEMRRKYIIDYFDEYELEYQRLVEDIRNTTFFDPKKIFELFYYIGKLNCLYHRDKPKPDYNENDHYFCMVNDNGIFALNTWLYAHFENVQLVGFTSKRSYFDGIEGCSIDMTDHDTSHIILDIGKNSEEKNIEAKYIYYQILNHPLTTLQKELYILVLWIMVHEDMKLRSLIPQKINPIISDFINMFTIDVGLISLQDEFTKFAFLYTEELIQSFLALDIILSNSEITEAIQKKEFTSFEYMLLGVYYVLSDLMKL